MVLFYIAEEEGGPGTLVPGSITGGGSGGTGENKFLMKVSW